MALPWMPIYWGDYVKDTLHLSTEEHGAYLLLICAYWQRGKSLPDEDSYFAQVTKLSRKKWKMVRPKISEFFEISEGSWRHDYVEKQLLSSSERQSSAKANGRAGGLAKSYLTTTTVTSKEEFSNKDVLKGLGKKGNTAFSQSKFSVEDPTKRLIAFQQKLLPYLGTDGARIMDVAMHPKHPDFQASYAHCRKMAREHLDLGMPPQWPQYDYSPS